MRIMITLKFGTLFLACVLVFCQMYILQAAPSRSREDPITDGVTLSNDDVQKLLRAIREFMQLALDDDHQPADGNSNTTTQKRSCNTATCVTHRLADYLSRSGGMGYRNFVPTGVGAQAFGKRRRRSPE
ncbi:calcitonin/calcitonin-related polypeptide, alpha [Nerophis lumbriciformis]|uniref:calcitonin/calcitonin-related polypeptide, alpha n=1 Tax=Nerophis lumbriciformis TaxID=546530 RepID=UPI002ADF6D27|nr:calcitonin gene-related peptide-like [Nerophis lumbriciformis]